MEERKKILVVDDEEVVTEYLMILLRKNNFDVVTAEDGAKGLSLVEKENPDVVLLDIEMPLVDGIEVCRRIKSNPDTRNIPVIFITGIEPSMQRRLYCLHIGAEAYFDKPINDRLLVEKINQILHKAKLEEEETAEYTGMPEKALKVEKHNFGGYEIIEILGAGGMSTVYKAIQVSLNRLVALKILSQNLSKSDRFVERFTSESKILARLNHPNIVKVFDCGVEGGFYYFSMEFVDGSSLGSLINKGNLSIEHYCHIIEYVGAALSYLHENNVIHRDIKPYNILISKDGLVKLTDFGISAMMQSEIEKQRRLTSGGWVGTFQYMSPEQSKNSAVVDFRSDIYSLGVTYYRMFTGHLPQGNFDVPSKLNPFLPKKIDKLILKSLAPKPDDRFSTVAEFTSLLLETLGSKQVETTKKTAFSQENPFQVETEPMAAKKSKPASSSAFKNLLANLPLFKSYFSGKNIIKISAAVLFLILTIILGKPNLSISKNHIDIFISKGIYDKEIPELGRVKFIAPKSIKPKENIPLTLEAPKDIDNIELIYSNEEQSTLFKIEMTEIKTGFWWTVIPDWNVLDDSINFYFKIIKDGKIFFIPDTYKKTPFTINPQS